MELDELKTMWKSNNEKLDKSIKLNEQNLEQIQSQKVASKLTPLCRQRIVECVFHVLALVLLFMFLFNNFSELPYAMSALALIAFYSTTLVNAVNQLQLIINIDYNKDIATIQSSLVLLQTHIVNYAKLAVLFIPAFLAFPVVISKAIKDYNIEFFKDFDIIARSNGSWWTMMVSVSAILIPLGLWFYHEVTYKNIHKPFVKRFIERSSGKSVTKALEFLNELQGSK
jgi:hypothetical protein